MRKLIQLAGLSLGLLLLVFTAFWYFKTVDTTPRPIPLKFDEAFIPHLEISIGGMKLEAKLDLGIQYSEINSRIIPKNQFSKLDEFKTLKGVASEETYQLCKLDHLKIDSITFSNIIFLDSKDKTQTFFNIDEANTSAEREPPPNLVLGNSMFSAGVILLNYSKGVLWIGKKAEDLFSHHLIDDSFCKGLLTSSDQHFSIEVLHDHQNRTFVIDTGCTYNFLLAVEDQNESLQMTAQENGYMIFNDQKFDLEETYLINRSLSGIDGFLGAPFLSKHLVAIDIKNKVLWIKPINQNENQD